MTDLPLVSIVMITYGQDKYIAQSINSILDQNYNGKLELIIVNDNSPDNTEKEVFEIISNHSKAHIINYYKHNKNLGVLNNFVWAINKASGKYVAICEGDDYWSDCFKLQKQVAILENNHLIGTCITNAMILNEIDDSFKIYSNLNTGFISQKKIFETGGSIYPTCSILFKNHIIDINTLLQYPQLAGDELLIFSLALKGKIFFLNENTCVYRRWEGGIYSSISKNHERLITQKLEEINGYDFFLSNIGNSIKKFIRKKISNNYLYIIRHSRLKPNMKLKYLRKMRFLEIIKYLYK